MRRALQIAIVSTILLLCWSMVAFGVKDPYPVPIETVWNKDGFKAGGLLECEIFEIVMVSLGILFLLAARPLSDGIPPKVEPKVEPEPKAEERGFGTLTLNTGGQLGKSYPIGEKGLIVGRDPGQCDIVISDPNVSRVHAWVTVRKGEAVVIDRGSTNGTYLNNTKVEDAKLKSGDVIQLGRKCMTTLFFKQ
jgi:hypothetical protein